MGWAWEGRFPTYSSWLPAVLVVHSQPQEKVQALQNSEKELKSNWTLKYSCNHFGGTETGVSKLNLYTNSKYYLGHG